MMDTAIRSVRSLADLLTVRCRQRPQELAYAFVRDTLEIDRQLTGQELECAAQALAQELRHVAQPGDRALLIYPPGVDVVVAFWGAILAGLIPVPAPAPDPIRRKHSLPRLRAIIADAQVSVILTTSSIHALAFDEEIFDQRHVAWIVTDQPFSGLGVLLPHEAGASDVAYLQYTSGSTSTPRGVMISHANVLAQCEGIVQSAGVTEASRSLCWLPYFHDYGLVHGIIAPLYAGIPAYLMSPLTFLRRPLRWLEAIGRYEVTHSGAPNFAYESCVQALQKRTDWTSDLHRWTVASCGAEPIHATTIQRFCEAFALYGFTRRAMVPAYGLAEATLVVTNLAQEKELTFKVVSAHALEEHRVEPVAADGVGADARTLVGCGWPLPGLTVAIADPVTRRECSAGVVGEIWVKGSSVSQGYWKQSELTATTFGQTMATGDTGSYLRTGDLGFLDEGQLYVTGRLKDLIILSGRNLYPHDLERTIQGAHPALREGACVAFSIEVQQAERLVVVHELDRAFNGDHEELATAIRAALAEGCEVSTWTVVLVRSGAIPKTSSGKVQRQACKQSFVGGDLPAVWTSVLPLERVLGTTRSTAPRDQIEQALIEIWAEVLEGTSPGVHDNFFDLGGHSLLATQVMSRVRETFNVELPLRIMFETPTIAWLAERIRIEQRKGREQVVLPPIVAVSHERPLPLSYSQQRMWVLYQLAPDDTAYNMPFASRQRGVLNKKALMQTIDALSHRHESFRTAFRMTGEGPVQVVMPWQSPHWLEVDLRKFPADQRLAEAKRLVQEEACRPFNLEKGPAVRFLLVQLSHDDHIFVVNLHHIVGDQWSFGVIGRDFAAWYNALSQGRPVPDESLPIQYADFALWQRRCLTDDALRPQLDYWKQQLTGMPILSMPTDRPRQIQQTYAGSYCAIPLSESVIEQLKHFSAQHRVTSFMTLLACFQILLSRYSGQTDIAVGSPIANRTHQAVEGLVGTFVNTLVLRTDLSGDPTFEELVSRVRETALGAYEHQDFPFERLIDVLQTERDPSYPPLVQTLFNVANVPIGELDLHGLSWVPFEIDTGTSQFDLSMTIETEIAKKIYLIFNTDLFDRVTAERMIRHYAQLLECALRQPATRLSAFPMLTQVERRQLLEVWNHTARSYPQTQCLPELFETQVEQTPEAVAVSMERHALTYRELNARANQLARRLRSLGVQPSSTVGIALDRSPDMVVALLAVLKAGGAYLPLDPDYPRDRIRFMVEDAEVSVVLTTSRLADRFEFGACRLLRLDHEQASLSQELDHNVPPAASGEDVAYVIYTSGSTGQPKGVEICHRSLVNFLWSMKQEPGCRAEDILLSVTTLSFDIAGLELYLPLLAGARVEIVSRSVAMDGRKLLDCLNRVRPTLMQATPATWRLLLDAGWKGNQGFTALCGGEALAPELATQLSQRTTALWNMYGPTETTIWSTMSRIGADQPVTIGRPIANTEIYILDQALSPVPIGVPGELYIGGHGVAKGYRRRPDLTRERFIPHPFKKDGGARLYRTGDIARYRMDGTIEHLGRSDHQVKIRGFRIELGEIETVLSRHPAIRQAVVVAHDDRKGLKQLVAYVVRRDGQSPTVTELRSFVRAALPEYMTPSHLTFLDALPLTANNKVDIRALPPPTSSGQTEGGVRVLPRNGQEVQLAALWQQVLGVEDVSVHDNFFDLGGHSLKAAQLFFLLEEIYGKQLPLATLFQAPTIAELAAILSQKQWAPPWQSLVAIQPSGKSIPIFMVPGVGGNVLIFAQLARLLGSDQPFYGLQARGLDGTETPFTTIPEMAAHYVGEIRRLCPHGPYLLAGACTGGLIAYEMAQQLVKQGESVRLAMIDSWHPQSYQHHLHKWPMRLWLPLFIIRKIWQDLWALRGMPVAEWRAYLQEKQETLRSLLQGGKTAEGREMEFQIERVTEATFQAVARYAVEEFPGRILNVIASKRAVSETARDTRFAWGRLSRFGTETYYIEAEDSGRLFVRPYVDELAEQLRLYLTIPARAESNSRSAVAERNR